MRTFAVIFQFDEPPFSVLRWAVSFGGADAPRQHPYLVRETNHLYQTTLLRFGDFVKLKSRGKSSHS